MDMMILIIINCPFLISETNNANRVLVQSAPHIVVSQGQSGSMTHFIASSPQLAGKVRKMSQTTSIGSFFIMFTCSYSLSDDVNRWHTIFKPNGCCQS